MRYATAILALLISFLSPASAQSRQQERLQNDVKTLTGLVMELTATQNQLVARLTNLELAVDALRKGSRTPGAQVQPGTQPSTPSLPVTASTATVTPAPSRPAAAAPATGVQCQATTKKGTQCSRMAQPGRSYCWQHP